MGLRKWVVNLLFLLCILLGVGLTFFLIDYFYDKNESAAAFNELVEDKVQNVIFNKMFDFKKTK